MKKSSAKTTIRALAREFNLDKNTVSEALHNAGISFEPGPHGAHLFDAAQARKILAKTQNITAQIREQRLELLKSQKALADQKRADYLKSQVPVADLWRYAVAMHSHMQHFIESLQLPFSKEVAACHNYVHAELNAWRDTGFTISEELIDCAKELARAEAELKAATAAGTIDNDWTKTPLGVREAVGFSSPGFVLGIRPRLTPTEWADKYRASPRPDLKAS
jgi:hypothetical protein